MNAAKVFQRLRETCLRHAGGLLLAVVFGALMAAPFVRFPMLLGTDDRGIAVPIQDDELYYLSMIREVVDGHPLVHNPYFWEHKETKPPQISVAPYALGTAFRMLGLRFPEAQMIMNALLPAIICLLTYAVAFTISRSRLQAAFAAILLVYGLFGFVFLRPISPQVNFIFWLSAFLLLYRLVTRPPRWSIALAAAANLGLLFYLYPYYWTQLVVLTGVLGFFLWFQHRRYVLPLAAVLAGAALLAIPYVHAAFLAAREPGYADAVTRLGTIFSRQPGAVLIIVLSAAGIAALVAVQRFRRLPLAPELLFFTAAILSGAIVSNQQIITGTIYQFSMHYHMQVVFMLVFASLFLVREAVPVARRAQAVVAFCILAAVFLSDGHGLGVYLRETRQVKDEARWAQRYAPAFAWLEENAATDDVVYANRLASDYLPVYTKTNVLFADSAANLTVPDAEFQDRYILAHYFDTFTPAYVRTNQRPLFLARYLNRASFRAQRDRYRSMIGLPTEAPGPLVPDEAVAAVIRRAEELQTQPLEAGLGPYRVDFVLWDTQRDPHWQFAGRKEYAEVFRTEEVVLFRYQRAGDS